MKLPSSWDRKTIDNIRRGYYSAVYFNRTREILLKEKNFKIATMQIFQKNDNAVLCGINHVVELLKIGTGYFEKGKWISKWKDLKIQLLTEGNIIKKGEAIMHITGPYVYFSHLESLYLGILARQTRVATQARNMVTAAHGKPILFFADRFDYFLNQELDGYAAHVGGVTNVCTLAQANLIDKKPVGTIPHALIAIHEGSTNAAINSFEKQFPETPLVALIDFENDCVGTSLKAAKQFGKKLWGVRLDTAENMVDKSLQVLKTAKKDSGRGLTKRIRARMTKKEIFGVNPILVKMVRQKLDQENFQHVKIIVSGGFNAEKIKWFEREKAPVDTYAVGSSMLDGRNDFTADIVEVEGREIAKVGRKLQENNKLKLVNH